MRYLLTILLTLYPCHLINAWGFWAHKHINRWAAFTLPSPMFTFYKHYLGYLTEQAVNPDKRRYVVEGEAEKHYIDVDHYVGKLQDLPRQWEQAVEKHTAAKLTAHGILPWHIYRVKKDLTLAFRNQSVEQILRLSADLGHYIADANVPLHTSENYNGQFTGQEGIHGLWEARLPELFSDSYNLFVGKATYVSDPKQRIWQTIEKAHEGVDSLLMLEKTLAGNFPAIQKFTFEIHGTSLRKVYSKDYARAYHTLLDGQVERQMQASIKMIGDFWFTCWIDGGQPDLDKLLAIPLSDVQFIEPLPDQSKLSIRQGCDG